MRITSKGQVAIPVDIREKAGLMPNEARADGGRGARAVARLRGKGDVAMTTDGTMALTRGEP